MAAAQPGPKRALITGITGQDGSYLAELLLAKGYQGEIRLDGSKPNGIPRKLVDVGKLFALGWRPQISLREGLRQTYEWFSSNYAAVV